MCLKKLYFKDAGIVVVCILGSQSVVSCSISGYQNQMFFIVPTNWWCEPGIWYSFKLFISFGIWNINTVPFCQEVVTTEEIKSIFKRVNLNEDTQHFRIFLVKIEPTLKWRFTHSVSCWISRCNIKLLIWHRFVVWTVNK